MRSLRTASTTRVHVRVRQLGVQRQPQQRRGDAVGDGQRRSVGADRAAVRRGMERHVVEGGHHPAGAQRRERRVARAGVGIEQVEDVVVGRALRKLRRQRNAAARGPVREPRAVAGDDGGAARLQALELVELHLEDGRQHVREHVAAALGDPGVLVDLAAQEGAAVRALLAGDLGSLGQLRVRDSERAALAAAHVLRLVEAEAARVAEGAQRAPAPACRDPLRRVLDHPQARGGARFRAGRPCRARPRVVDRQDRGGAWSTGAARRPRGRARACAPRCRRTPAARRRAAPRSRSRRR